MVNFRQSEQNILALFTVGQSVIYERQKYEVIKSGKPTCGKGEPKTDIYVLLQDNQNAKTEVKISYKKDNADFLENKIGAERAELLFGADWANIIKNSTQQIQSQFHGKPLIYKSKQKRTDRGAITLGWKFELMNKPSGELSGKMVLTPEQYLDVYSGSNLPIDKRNATVDGEEIVNSGVATHILLGNTYSSAQDVLDNIRKIEDYINDAPEIYFACKALNYRTFEQKFDGNRPLAVQVKWDIINGKLSPQLVFDEPLSWNGNAAAEQLKNCLQTLNIQTTDDINDTNVDSSRVYE